MRTTPLLALAALAATVSVAGAQTSDDTIELQRPVRGAAGGHLYYAKPVGEFSDYINRGFGGAAHAMIHVGPSNAVALRIDGSYMNYGRETVRTRLGSGPLGRIDVDVTTTNNIAFVGAGPQFMVPDGPIRPYVAGQLGWTFIWTNSSLEDVDDDRGVLDSQNISDNTFSYGGLGGILVPLTAGRNPVSLDFGARYLRNGSVRYLREGDIVDDVGSGAPFLNIQRSRADLVTYYLGVSVALR